MGDYNAGLLAHLRIALLLAARSRLALLYGYLFPVVFLLSFLESFAFVSLIVPATFILLGVGALIGAAGVGFLFAWAPSLPR